MRTVLLVVALLACFSSYSQKCRFTKNETDEFTGQRVIISNADLVRTIMGTSVGISFRLNRELQIGLYIATTGMENLVIQQGEPFYIKLSNGETIELKSLAEYKEETFMAGTTKVHYLDPRYSVTIEDLKRIQKNNVSKARIVISGRNMEFEVKPKLLPDIASAINCFMQEIQ